jgi:RNA polymerase sigma-70 factor, ECF subfamily
VRAQSCNPNELRQRAAKRDPQLLADLFTCFRTDLLGFLRKRCNNTGDADDALQDAFVAATRYLSNYKGETPLKNWLYKLASSACTHMRRGRKNDPKLHCQFNDAAPAGTGRLEGKIESLLEARLSPLQKALDSLAEMDRAVLMLRDGEQMSAREVAKALSLTESAVKSRLHRARRTVQKFLLK